MGTIDLTPLLEAVIALTAVAISGYIIPYIKAKTSERTYENIRNIASIAVGAAEQLAATGVIKKEEKKEYVLEILKNHGFTLNYSQLEAVIEAAVRAQTNMEMASTSCEPLRIYPEALKGETKARDEPEDIEENNI